MKIFVKTLKGARFEIQVKPEDSVADVKKNIETVLGVNAYPAAEQRLIHKGKVLKDETTVEANNVSEKSTIGVMKRKPASASLKPLYESISENNIQWILEMSGGEWERDLVEDALYLAYNDIDKAVEYIYFGLPVDSEYPSITEFENVRPRVQSDPSLLEELLVQIEDLFITEGETHQEPDERPSAADLEQSLDFARYTQEYDREYLRALARSHPSIVKDFVEMVHEDNPLFFQFIRDNKADILRLLREGGTGGTEMEQPREHPAVETNEPKNGGDGGNQVGESKETEVEVVTPEDYELIERLEALGFERGDAAVAYFACNRNLQVAANHLLGYKHKHEPRRE
ncbi:ubiquitin receptor RAD23c-like [Brassica rapa]|uniref:ubiquitin receptor RAD23c-like n=1 Tax=Brassica campestris TaxID=3711 RepID=UPI0006AAAD6A|nr:ubiquitin receptor RAD23c-like [Brassica rapa]